jgi:DNA-directed RNA polymerase specialized sigma24 family protein
MELLRMFYWDGFRADEIAARSDLSAPAMRKRLERARSNLRSSILTGDNGLD